VLVSLVVMACGAPEVARDGGLAPVTNPAPDAGRSAADAGVMTLDAGPVDAGAPRKLGTVGLVQQRVVIPGLDPILAGGVSAFFFQQPVGCSVSLVDGCELTECSTPAAFDAGTSASAGTLSFEGLDVDGGLAVPFSNGYSAQVLSQVFSLDRVVTVRASGGDVPAFSAQVTAPEGTLLTSPTCQSSSCGAVSLGRPLEVRWSAPTRGTVVVELSTGGSMVRCTLPASDRRATVSTAVLSRLRAGQGVLTVGGTASTTVAAGAWDVTFTTRDTVFGLVDLQP
jgi:hypothetical protein